MAFDYMDYPMNNTQKYIRAVYLDLRMLMRGPATLVSAHYIERFDNLVGSGLATSERETGPCETGIIYTITQEGREAYRQGLIDDLATEIQTLRALEAELTQAIDDACNWKLFPRE